MKQGTDVVEEVAKAIFLKEGHVKDVRWEDADKVLALIPTDWSVKPPRVSDYYRDIARAAIATITRLRLAAPVGEEKLWLWKNGDHFWAFRHLYPCHMDGGDPQTLGEPFGWAILKPSAPPADSPHRADDETDTGGNE